MDFNFFDLNDYNLDIFSAILSVREVEGDIMVSVRVPNKRFKYARYKKYPYDKPYYGKKFVWNSNTEDEFRKQMKDLTKILNERVIPYLQEYIDVLNVDDMSEEELDEYLDVDDMSEEELDEYLEDEDYYDDDDDEDDEEEDT